MLWSSTSHVLFTPFTFLTILAIEVHITWDLSGTSNCLTQGRNCQFGIDVSSFKYEAKKLKRLIFLLLGFGGFSLFFCILFGIFLQSGMGLFGLGFEGVVGELPVICSKIFFFMCQGMEHIAALQDSSLIWKMFLVCFEVCQQH